MDGGTNHYVSEKKPDKETKIYFLPYAECSVL